MSSSYGITPQNLLLTLPDVLREDRKMLALATSIATRLSEMAGQADQAAIYTRINELPEDVLDALATDFKVDWWSYDYTIQEKRRTLKDSWYVHRHLGTKKAVERAISAIFEDTEVAEWFEYNGKPYHFRLKISLEQATLDPVKHSTVLSLVAFYKNLRSILDEIAYDLPTIQFTTANAFLFKEFNTGIRFCRNTSTEMLLFLEAFQCFLFFQNQNRWTIPCGLNISVATKNSQAYRLEALGIGIRFQNYGGNDLILLDGRKTLDGTWLLDQTINGLYFKVFEANLFFTTPESFCGSSLVFSPHTLQNSCRSTFESFRSQTGIENSQTFSNHDTQFNLGGIRQEYKFGGGSVVMDSMYKLDGSVLLDGSRKLNADIIKEVL